MIKLATIGFGDCCGIQVTYNFGGVGSLNSVDKEYLQTVPINGLNLIALAHFQWNQDTLQFLKSAGWVPVVEDFYNGNSANKITLFAKVAPQHKAIQGKGSLWSTFKKIFQDEPREDKNTSITNRF